jgi:DNA-binding NtrC family response regulator
MGAIILIVDDDPSVHAALLPLLELEGFGVLGARTLDEAIGVVEREACDIVLADLSLSAPGGREGLVLVERLKARRPDLPVILFTARGTAEIFAEAKRRGAADAWSKDVEIPELLRRVRAVEGGRKKEDR